MNSPAALSVNKPDPNSDAFGAEQAQSPQSGGIGAPEAAAARKPRRAGLSAATLYGFLFGGWLALLGVGLLGYFHTVLPLKKETLAQQVRSIALALDTAIRERCLVVDAVAGNLEIEAFLKQGAMPNMVNRIRSTFPDFLTVQLVDQTGTIVGAAGEVSSPDGTIPSTVTIDWAPDSSGLPGGWRFGDDPSTNQWHLTCKHSGSRAGVWFVRATFSRAVLQNAAARAGLSGTTPFSMTRFAGAYRPGDYGVEAGSSSLPVWFPGSRWTSATRAETPLAAGGWVVGLNDRGHNRRLLLYPAVVVGAMVLCMVGSLVAVTRFARRDDGADHQESRSEPPSAAGYAAVVEDDGMSGRGEDAPGLTKADIRSAADPADEEIVAMAVPDEIPEFLEVSWDEPVEQELDSHDAAGDAMPTAPSVSVGA